MVMGGEWAQKDARRANAPPRELAGSPKFSTYPHKHL